MSTRRSVRCVSVLASVLLASALLPAAARAQNAPPDLSGLSAQSLRQILQELDALKAEEARARAAE